jgi:hypothetical protein
MTCEIEHSVAMTKDMFQQLDACLNHGIRMSSKLASDIDERANHTGESFSDVQGRLRRFWYSNRAW